jgi:hypothetical protein
MAYWSEISHYACEYLAWSPSDLLSVFVVESLHGDNFCYKDKGVYVLVVDLLLFDDSEFLRI